MASRDGGFRIEAAREQLVGSKRIPEQSVGRHRACDGRCRASSLSARERKPFAAPQRDAVLRAGATQYRGSGERGGVARRISRQLDMPGVRHVDTRLVTSRDGDLITPAYDRAAQHVESGADIADAARCARRDPAAILVHAVTMRRTSPSTPAAVTTAPAPGPDTTSGRCRYRLVMNTNRLSVPSSDASGLPSGTRARPVRTPPLATRTR